ncbi:glycerophosphodiester phosphodiesterase [Thiotrichales bacterium 19S3-7]|nr:glycerophosphodiester phosphodiesterase [Thiotrichales bacterium 19S3-7]MCF6801228.1 glycerophosphodiester phosphodiesterase [Thiotrichales bacterium 19S3-11]
MKKVLLGGVMVALSASNINAMGSQLVSNSQVTQYNGRKTPNTVVQIYAHRGGRGLAPENTIPAYQSALRLGVDYVDMDVGITKDGVVVVTHDLELNPEITQRDGKFIKAAIPIYDLTFKELQTYDVGKLKPNTDYANYFPMQYQIDDVHIPTLKEVIRYVKSISGNQVGFQIEIKTDPKEPQKTVSPEEFAIKVYQVLKEEKVIDRSEIQAFEFRCLLKLQQLDKNIKTAYLTDHTNNPKVASKKKRTLWTAGYDVKDYDNSFPKMVKALGGNAWEPYEMDLTQDELIEAQKLGLKVVVWGWPEEENTEFNYHRVVELINWGIDGIITDRPDQLRGILSARGYNLPKGYQI